LKRAKTWVNAHFIDGAVDLNEKQVITMFETPVYGVAHINHYYTKSWEDFVEQLKTGTLSYNNRNCDDFFAMNPDLRVNAWDMITAIADDYFPSTDCLSRELGIFTNKKRTAIAQLNRRTNYLTEQQLQWARGLTDVQLI
jgi:hypothetical protein